MLFLFSLNLYFSTSRVQLDNINFALYFARKICRDLCDIAYECVSIPITFVC